MALPASQTNADPVLYRGHLPHLDGLRAIALLLVVSVHSPAGRVFYFGWAGVDLFFVLSGFLITGILLDARASSSYFRTFIVRRSLRIWPLYYAFLALFFLVLPAFYAPFRDNLRDHPPLPYLLYVQNFFMAGQPNSPIWVTWSLAIEEQFYLVWPLVVYLVPRRALLVVTAAIAALSPVVRFLLMSNGVPSGSIYLWTFTRLDGLALGAFIAALLRGGAMSAHTLRRAGIAIAAVALPIGMWLALDYTPEAGGAGPLQYAVLFSCFAVGFAGALGAALTARPLQRALSIRPLRHLGKISYGFYIYHVAVFQMVHHAFQSMFPDPTVLQKVLKWLVAYPLALAIAELSFRFFESPILQWRDRAARPAGAPTQGAPRSALENP
jgi:peptidoglycan/LPS O-acetylase OafA/YrhL